MGKSETTIGRDYSLTFCPFRKEGATAILPCTECTGKADLGKGKCLSGVLRILENECGLENVVLAGYHESIYSGKSMEILCLMADILSETEKALEDGKGEKKGRKCAGCEHNLKNLARLLRKNIVSDMSQFYELLQKLSSAQHASRDCQGCVDDVRERLLLVFHKSLVLRNLLLQEGYGIVIDPGGKTKSGGPIEKKTAPDQEKILAQFNDTDFSNMSKGLLISLNKSRRVRPCFSRAWIDPEVPQGCLASGRRLMGARIRFFSLPGASHSLFHLLPDEYGFKEEDVRLIQDVKNELLSREVGDVELEKQAQIRNYVERTARSLFARRLMEKGLGRVEASEKAQNFASLLARYTAGLGVLEYLLACEEVQDVYVDSPCDSNPVYLTAGVSHPDLLGKMTTNIMLDQKEAETAVSRLRHISGQPFSEANPVLETDLEGHNTRATAIGPPLSPSGVAFAFRRHSTDPWTLPRLVSKKSISDLAAGLLWFLVDGRSTMLIAGSRGAGKSSLLSALLFSLPKSQRMLAIEDTLELPVNSLQELGFNAQSLRIGRDFTGRDALRVSLRLGESALVLGEVRGEEAKLLYEAMRTGTAGSTVLGTFHADSPRSIYERVVHDLGIPYQSFSATDMVVISGLVRPKGGLNVLRRVTNISEVDKQNEGKFRTLMEYDDEKDCLVAGDDFYYRSEIISSIARGWGMRMEEAVEDIHTRGKIMGTLVEKGGDFIKADWTARAFSQYKTITSATPEPDPAGWWDAWHQWFSEMERYG
ncbi:MAG: type II/IV secretion system ATPase subunit [Candidatus Thermoplasmatota archaeon]|nr:type II/IV secretion system ATPase subunit [Candidatus Thermoplasmatota archaeon]